jgi:hypothetical protein
VFFLKELPLSGTNKIDRERLREWVATGASQQVSGKILARDRKDS